MRSLDPDSILSGQSAPLSAAERRIGPGIARGWARLARQRWHSVLGGALVALVASSVAPASAQGPREALGAGAEGRGSTPSLDAASAEPTVAPGLVTEPWFTGPLIAPGATTLDAGDISLQPFLSGGTALASEAVHGRVNPEGNTAAGLEFDIDVSVGLTDRFTLTISPAGVVGFVDQEQSFAGFGDLPVELQAQLWRGRHGWLVPDLLLHVEESFPTGAYQRLDSNTEAIGSGSFITTMGLTGGRLWHLHDEMWLHLLGDLSGAVGSEVEVQGINTYGGDPATRGRVDPGDFIELQFGAELSLTRQWAVALDLEMIWVGASTFRADRVRSRPDLPQAVVATGLPASSLLSFAPALEYSVSADFGFIGGLWVGVAGRNSPTFVTGVFSTVWTF